MTWPTRSSPWSTASPARSRPSPSPASPQVTAAGLEAAQQALFDQASARLQAATVDVATLEEAREASQTGFARVPWSLFGAEGEALLATSAVTVRCLVRPDGGLPASDDEPDLLAVTGRSY